MEDVKLVYHISVQYSEGREWLVNLLMNKIKETQCRTVRQRLEAHLIKMSGALEFKR